MRTAVWILALGCTLAAAARAEASVSLDIGVESVLLGRGQGNGEALDGLFVGLGRAADIGGGRSIGVSLAWRWQPHYDSWHPFAPEDGFDGGPVHCIPPGSHDGAHYFELTFLGRTERTAGTWRPFSELEFGCAAIDLPEGPAGDLLLGVRAGVDWQLSSEFALRGSSGYRLYFVGERHTVSLSIGANITF